jgi:hypothetical protein
MISTFHKVIGIIYYQGLPVVKSYDAGTLAKLKYPSVRQELYGVSGLSVPQARQEPIAYSFPFLQLGQIISLVGLGNIIIL